jgi:hypothetical protein
MFIHGPILTAKFHPVHQLEIRDADTHSLAGSSPPVIQDVVFINERGARGD